MKLRIVAAGAFAVLGLAAAWAQNKNVKVSIDEPAAPPAAKSAPKPANPSGTKAAPSQPAPKADAKKADEMGKITGIEIPRGGGFMGIEIVNGTFRLSFYDAKKKPIAPDVDRAALKWTVKTQSLPERIILNRDGNALSAAKVIKPPYNFSLAITLFKGEGDAAATENFSVAFSQ